MDPKGPSQPPLDTAYDQPSNPATQTESEEQYSKSTSASIQRSDPVVDRRERGDVPVPSQHEEAAVPSSLGYGVRDDRHDAGESVRDCPPPLPSFLWLSDLWSPYLYGNFVSLQALVR